LEAIEQELAEGNQVTEIYRNDPNINIRSSIYSRAWSEIKNHPLFGIGWGGIGGILGVDGRGVGLNSSNIFLEIWLGSGIIGFLAFVVLWIYVLLRAAHAFLHRDGEGQAVALFIILAWAGLTVFNLFNAGIMLAIFWVFLAVSLMDYKAE
jgi:O-antigen ligase